jgi:hypothetical protein
MSVDVTELRLAPYHPPPTRPRDLLRWFLDGVRADVPIRLSTGGDYPVLSHEMATYLGEPGALDRDEDYRFPMRAALRELAHDEPFMAQVLYRTACIGGDWDSACRSLGMVQPVRRAYVQVALELLHGLYRREPRGRVLRYRPTAIDRRGDADSSRAGRTGA